MKFRNSFVTNSSSSSYIICFARIADEEKAQKIIDKSSEIPVVGICGGFQILGEEIIDEEKKESKQGTIKGLGLLPITSEFERSDKIVTQSEAIIPNNLEGIAGEMFKNIAGETVTGYEIHEGTSNLLNLRPSNTNLFNTVYSQ